MKPITRQMLSAVFLAVLATSSMAQQIVGVKTKKVEVYARPDDDKPLAVIDPVGLPWNIKEERNEFFRVQLNGKDVWVDAMQVTVLRDSADKCPPRAPSQGPSPDVVAASPGAGALRCR